MGPLAAQDVPFWALVQYSFTQAGTEQQDHLYVAGSEALKTNGVIDDAKLKPVAYNQILNKIAGSGAVVRAYTVTDIIKKSTSGCLFQRSHNSGTSGSAPFMSPDDINQNSDRARRQAGDQDGTAGYDNMEDFDELFDNLYVPDETDEGSPPKKPKLSASILCNMLSQTQSKDWDCTGEGCNFSSKSEAVLLYHWKDECPFNPNRADKTADAHHKVKFSEWDITVKVRDIAAEKDDNK